MAVQPHIQAGHGSKLQNVTIVLAGVAALIASLISFVYVSCC